MMPLAAHSAEETPYQMAWNPATESMESQMRVLALDCGTRSEVQQVAISEQPDSFWEYRKRFGEQMWSAKWVYGGIFAATTAIGVVSWDWGSAGFTFKSEGWFDESTKYGGMDKLGHAFTGYLMSDALTWAIRRNSIDPRGAELTGALLSVSLMTYIEIFDGLSAEHGFSYEDLVAGAVGATFSALRNTYPELKNKVDFRMQYLKSEYGSFEPFGDYEGQKYLVAVKLAGFEALRDTPLKYVEVQGGYCARGFSDEEMDAGSHKQQDLFVGIGVNLSELIFGEKASDDHWGKKAGRTVLQYVQVPYTYVSTSGSGR